MAKMIRFILTLKPSPLLKETLDDAWSRVRPE